MDIFKRMKIADYVTLANGIAGLAAVFFSLQASFTGAAIAMLLAVAFDYLDGMFARFLRQGNPFGEQLDTIADIISFGVAPAVFLYQLGFAQPWHLIVYTIFVAAGMLRLARFNVTHEYLGMPITMNGIAVPALFFIQPDFIIYYFIIAIFLMLSAIRFRRDH